MGLMLSVLIVCVGVIEALSCYEHFQYGVIHCATNVYENARRRSSVFLKYTSRRLKLLTDDSMPEEPETVQIVQEDIYGHGEPEPEPEPEPKQFKPIKKLEKDDKIQIVKTLLEKPARPKAVRSISMPEFVYTERDIELSKIINSLVIEPIEEINIEVEDVNTEVLTKEFDKLFDECENESDILLKNVEDSKSRVRNAVEKNRKVAREPVKINSKRRNDETTHSKKVIKPLEEVEKGSPVDRFTSADFDAVTTVKCNKSKSMDLDVFYKFEDDSKLNELPILVESSNKLNDAIFENDTPPAELIDKTFEEIYNDIPDDSLNEYEEIEKSILCGFEWNANASEKENRQVLCVENEEKILSNNCGKISDPVFLRAVEQLAELIVKDCLNLNRMRKQILENLKNKEVGYDPTKHHSGTKTIPNGSIPCHIPEGENLTKSAKAVRLDTMSPKPENCSPNTSERMTNSSETLLPVEYKEEFIPRDRTGVTTEEVDVESPLNLAEQAEKPKVPTDFVMGSETAPLQSETLLPLDHKEENKSEGGTGVTSTGQQNKQQEQVGPPLKLLELIESPKTPTEIEMCSERRNYSNSDQCIGNKGSVPPKSETLQPLDHKEKNKSVDGTGAVSTEQSKQEEQMGPTKLSEQTKASSAVEIRSEQNNYSNLDEFTGNAGSVPLKPETLLVEYKEENKSKKDATGAKSTDEQNKKMDVGSSELVEQIGEPEDPPPGKPEAEIHSEQRNQANLDQSPVKSEIVSSLEEKEQCKSGEDKIGEQNKQVEQVESSLIPIKPEVEIHFEQYNSGQSTRNSGSVPQKFETQLPPQNKEDRTGAVFIENKIQQEPMDVQVVLNLAEQIGGPVKSEVKMRSEQNNYPNLNQTTVSAVPPKSETLLPLENPEKSKSEEIRTEAISTEPKIPNEQMESPSKLLELKLGAPKEIIMLSEQNCWDQTTGNAGSVRSKSQTPLPLEQKKDCKLEEDKPGKPSTAEQKKLQEQVESCSKLSEQTDKLEAPPPLKTEVEISFEQNSSGKLEMNTTGMASAEPKMQQEPVETLKLSPQIEKPPEVEQRYVDKSTGDGGSVPLKPETLLCLGQKEDRTGVISTEQIKQQKLIEKPRAPPGVELRSELNNLDQSTENEGSVPPESQTSQPMEQKEENKLEDRTAEQAKPKEQVESALKEQIEKPRAPPEAEQLSEQNNYANLNESTGNAESHLPKSESLLPLQHEREIKSENDKKETISAEHKIEKDIKHTKALQLENLGEPAFKLEENSNLKLELNFAKESVSPNFDENPGQNKTEHSACPKDDKTTANSSSEEAFWLIFSGEYTKAMSKDWHSGHFSCWQCDEALTGQRYVLRDDHPYCIKCYESVFANVCEECNKIIGIDSKDLSYKDKHWHEACFLCNKCRVSLVDKQFGSKADKIYCGNCYDAQFASRCDGCGEIFRAGTKKMEYKTRQWHEKCFCCCVCKTPIGTKSFIPREQEIYCATCYEEKFATRCVKCNKIITSGGVTYKNEPWHRECFTCTNCNTSLAGQRFTSRDEKPYCADCFGELFAKRCTACSRPITGIGGTRFISFEDRHWHNDCFICASCKTSLVGRGFITDGDDIICPECAKQKLM